jgi:hypothetical protein
MAVARGGSVFTYNWDFGTSVSFGFGGVGAGEMSDGGVSKTNCADRTGFGVRCSSSNMRSTRAVRSPSRSKYSMETACARPTLHAVKLWTPAISYERRGFTACQLLPPAGVGLTDDVT